MSCEELQPDYMSFALGIADEPERGQIAEHLTRGCPSCVSGVKSAMTTVAVMSGAVHVSNPPSRLKKRILAAVEREPSRGRLAGLLPWALTAALSIALITIGVSGRRQTGNTAKLEQALPILNDPANRDVSFGETGKPSRGRVFVSADHGMVLVIAGLPHLDANRTFELWVFPAKGNPIPAGLFEAQTDDTAVYVHPGRLESVSSIALSIEPSGGSPQPTSTPFLAVKI